MRSHQGHPQHIASSLVGEKEALRICRQTLPRLGKMRLRHWAKTVIGLRVRFSKNGHGYYVVAILEETLRAALHEDVPDENDE